MKKKIDLTFLAIGLPIVICVAGSFPCCYSSAPVEELNTKAQDSAIVRYNAEQANAHRIQDSINLADYMRMDR